MHEYVCDVYMQALPVELADLKHSSPHLQLYLENNPLTSTSVSSVHTANPLGYSNDQINDYLHTQHEVNTT
jgi:hypothetical protein